MCIISYSQHESVANWLGERITPSLFCYISLYWWQIHVYIEMVCWEGIPISFHLVCLVLIALVFVLKNKFYVHYKSMYWCQILNIDNLSGRKIWIISLNDNNLSPLKKTCFRPFHRLSIFYYCQFCLNLFYWFFLVKHILLCVYLIIYLHFFFCHWMNVFCSNIMHLPQYLIHLGSKLAFSTSKFISIAEINTQENVDKFSQIISPTSRK